MRNPVWNMHSGTLPIQVSVLVVIASTVSLPEMVRGQAPQGSIV